MDSAANFLSDHPAPISDRPECDWLEVQPFRLGGSLGSCLELDGGRRGLERDSYGVA